MRYVRDVARADFSASFLLPATPPLFRGQFVLKNLPNSPPVVHTCTVELTVTQPSL